MIFENYTLDKSNILSNKEVVEIINKNSNITDWGIKTNFYAINYINRINKNYNGSWYKIKLKEEDFNNILLQEHRHNLEDNQSPILFNAYSNIKNAVDKIKKEVFLNKNCLRLIFKIKNSIENNGFNSVIYLAYIDDKLLHIDGLHRLIAQGLLLDDGHKYKPINTIIFINE